MFKHRIYRFFVFSLAAAMLAALVPAQLARAAGTTITVNTINNTTGDGLCSFQEAMAAATTNTSQDSGACPDGVNLGAADPDIIEFNISGSGVHTITLSTPIDITDVVVIDGTSQPGYTNSPLIRIDGANAVSGGLVFNPASNGSTLKAVMVTRFTTVGVAVQTGSGSASTDHVTLVGNYIGNDGSSALGNAIGLQINNANYTHVGGPLAANRNVISGNTLENIVVQSLVAAANHNLIQNNYIGVNAAGTAALGGDYGIYLYNNNSGGVLGTQITGNLISGNNFDGILMTLNAGVDSTLIANNKIGTDATGTSAISNGGGMEIDNGSGTTITGNLISGTGTGIYIAYSGVTNTTISGNFIGTNAAGTAALANSVGINIEDGANTLIGGTTAGSGNLISGNTSYGIRFNGGNPTNTKVLGNRIGTNVTGMSAVPNGGDAILLSDAPANLGDAATPGRNLISGNSGVAIHLTASGTSGTTIFGNKMGVNRAGSAALGNAEGIDLDGGASAQISGNWIANTGSKGVAILDLTSSAVSGSSNNCFTGNVTDGVYSANTNAGTAPFTNDWWGAADGPSGAGAGSGDPVSANVDFSPFRTTAAPACSPAVSLSKTSLSFGNQLVGTSSAAKTVTLTNTGAKVLTFTSITKTGSFSLIGSTCPLGAGKLGSGSSCLIKVKFAPTSTGIKSGSVSITTDAATSPNHIVLSGTGVAGTQLLKNPGFETDANLDKKPDNWTYSNFAAATDKRDCTVRKSGTCSLKFQGNGTQKVAAQTIFKSGVAGDDFTFALWSRASSVPVGSVYRLQVLFYNGGTLKGTKTMNFNVGTHLFQKVSGTFTASTAYTKIIYRIQFKAASGTAWFDVADLRWAP